MKVLHIVTSLDPKAGGVTQAVISIVCAMAKLRIHSEIATFDAESNYFDNKQLIVHNLGPARTSWQYTPKFAVWLKDHLSSYTHVILHGLWQYHTYAFFQVKEQLPINNLKVHIMPHGMLDPWFQKAKGRRLKAIRNSIYWQLIEKKVVNHADGLLFTCEQELLLARETFSSYYPKTEHNVGYGIAHPPAYTTDMKQAFYELCPQVEGRPYLLFLSRLHNKKGVDILLQAYLQLKHEGMELPILVIAGPGLDSPYGQRLRAQVVGESGIFFPGMLGGHSKWGALYGCEAFILPSHQENFGIAVVEAMACAKPVLISDQVNIYPEIVAGGAGIVTKDTFAETVLAIKKWLWLSSIDKQKMGMRALNVFQEKFNVQLAAKRLAQILLTNINVKNHAC